MNVEKYLRRACASERAMSIRVSVARWMVLHPGPPRKYGTGCRTSVYLETVLLDEMAREANRQGIALSALVQQSWLVAAAELKQVVSPKDL